MDSMSIHKTNDGSFVIASGGMWLHGSYADERAAKYAFRFTDVELAELRDRICRVDIGEGRNITFEDLQTYRKNHPCHTV